MLGTKITTEYINNQGQIGTDPSNDTTVRKKLLLSAVQHSDLDTLRKIASDNGSQLVNDQDDKGTTPLMLAIRKINNINIVQLLMSMGANLYQKNPSGHSAIGLAHQEAFQYIWLCDPQKKHEDKTKHYTQLLKFFIQELLSSRSHHTQEPPIFEGKFLVLISAVLHSDLPFLEKLVEHHADEWVNLSDNTGTTPLMWAMIKMANIDVIACLLRIGANIYQPNLLGKSSICLLHEYIEALSPNNLNQETQNYYLTLVNLFWSHALSQKEPHASANCYSPRNQISILMSVVIDSNFARLNPISEPAIRELVHSVDDIGMTPLMWAINLEVEITTVQFFLSMGANLYQKDRLGRRAITFLHTQGFQYIWLCDLKNPHEYNKINYYAQLFDLFLKKRMHEQNVSIDKPHFHASEYKLLVLLSAVIHGDLSFLQSLREHNGAQFVNTPDSTGMTVIMWAVVCMVDIKIVELLVQMGADLSQKNASQRHVVHIAKEYALSYNTQPQQKAYYEQLVSMLQGAQANHQYEQDFLQFLQESYLTSVDYVSPHNAAAVGFRQPIVFSTSRVEKRSENAEHTVQNNQGITAEMSIQFNRTASR